MSESESLRNKHGDIYRAMMTAIDKAATQSGAFADEATRAAYVSETAAMFADQVLAEANFRKVAIDDVLKASDIVFEDGGIKFKTGTQAFDDAGNVLEQAMYLSKAENIEEFYNIVVSGEEKRPIYFQQQAGNVLFDVPADTVRHDVNKHSITVSELSGVFNALNDGKIKEAYYGDYQRYSGVPVKMSVDVDGREYGVSFERLKNGRNILGTVFKLTDKTWLKRKNAQANPSYPDSKSRPLGHSLNDIIAEIEADSNTPFHQSAFAGSRVDYDKPSLEAINSGEGAQAIDEKNQTLYQDNQEQYKEYENGKIYDYFIQKHSGLGLIENAPEFFEGQTKEDVRNALNMKDGVARIKSPIETVKILESHINHLFDDNEDARKKFLYYTIRTIEKPNIIVQQGNKNSYFKFFLSNNKVKPHLQIVKVASDGSFYVTNFRPTKNQFSKKIKEGQVVYNLSNVHNKGVPLSDNNNMAQYGGGVKGSYSPYSRLIKLTEKADYSTLPHEFAHFWLSEMQNWVNSGLATDDYLKRYDIAMDWLKAEAGKPLSRRAQEQFARGYEQYLLNGNLPESPMNPLYAEYDKWLKAVYDDLNQPSKKPLTTDMVRFFQSMTTGTLPETVLPPVNVDRREKKENGEGMPRPEVAGNDEGGENAIPRRGGRRFRKGGNCVLRIKNHPVCGGVILCENVFTCGL